MPEDFPYMVNAGNIPAILNKIQKAGTPPRFTLEFLRTSLGFKSSNDRAVIGVLKNLGMLTPSGDPTPRYNEFKDSSKSGAVLATGLRDGWEQVFLADQDAHKKTRDELKGLFQNLSGKSENVSDLMARTFKNLADLADWDTSIDQVNGTPPEVDETEDRGRDADRTPLDQVIHPATGTLTLHNDIHIHLPNSPEASVYTAIFRALREELLDD